MSGCGPPEPGTEPAPRLLLQTYTAVYYVLADLVMLGLYFHYKFKNRPSPCEYGGPLCEARRGSGERGRKQLAHCWEIKLQKASWALSASLNPDRPG